MTSKRCRWLQASSTCHSCLCGFHCHVLQLLNQLFFQLFRHLILFRFVAVCIYELHHEIVKDLDLRIMCVHVLNVSNQAIKIDVNWLNIMMVNLVFPINMVLMFMLMVYNVLMVRVLYDMLMLVIVLNIKSNYLFLQIKVPVDVAIARDSVVLGLIAPRRWNSRFDKFDSTWDWMPFLFLCSLLLSRNFSSYEFLMLLIDFCDFFTLHLFLLLFELLVLGEMKRQLLISLLGARRLRLEQLRRL